jgi:hypothetical protein
LYQLRIIDEYGEVGEMRIGRGNRSTRGENLPQCHLSTKNPTWLDMGSKPGLRDRKSAIVWAMTRPWIWFYFKYSLMRGIVKLCFYQSAAFHHIKLSEFEVPGRATPKYSRRILDRWSDLCDFVAQRVTRLYNSVLDTHIHTLVSTVTSSLAVARDRLPTADVSLPLGSRTIPGHTYQLLTATTHKDWNTAVF